MFASHFLARAMGESHHTAYVRNYNSDKQLLMPFTPPSLGEWTVFCGQRLRD